MIVKYHDKTVIAGTFTSPTLVTPALGTPASGVLTNCTGYPLGSLAGIAAGVADFLATPSSANLRTAVTDESGTGALLFASGALGTPASGTLTNCTGLPISTGVSGLASDVATFLATPSSANLRTMVTDESGTGALLFASGALGTPASGTLTNCTGLPVSTGLSGLGSGVATFLATATTETLPRTMLLGSDHTNTSETGTEATGLSVTSLAAGTYVFKYSLLLQTSAASTGVSLGVNFTGTTSRQVIMARFVSTGTTDATGVIDNSALTLTGQFVEGFVTPTFSTTSPNITNTAFAASNTDSFAIIEGILVATGTGDLELWLATASAGDTARIESGSSVVVTKVV